MWVEVPGSPSFEEGGGGTARLVRMFQADLNQGGALAKTNGYTKGTVILHEGYSLEIANVGVRNATGQDIVTVTYVTPGGYSPRSRIPYNDGKLRKNGDEEWRIEVDGDVAPASECYTHDGNAWSGTWGIDEAAVLQQPAARLVWRKWMNKNTAAPNQPPITLPTTKAQALIALNTYMPGATGAYETNAPKIMFTLGSSGIEKKLLCVEISLESDGDLVCRTAKFRWQRTDYDTTVYGTPS